MWFMDHFTKGDNSVYAVPKSWWKHCYCAWPKKNIKHSSKLMELNKKPDKVDFEYFKSRLLSKHPIGWYNFNKLTELMFNFPPICF